MDFFQDTWTVLDEYFKSKYFLTQHHLDSYNDFVQNKLLNTIRVLNPFVIKKEQENGKVLHQIEIFIGGEKSDEIFINKPTIVEKGEQRIMYPNEARLKDMTYKADVFANITVKYHTTNEGKYSFEDRYFTGVKIGSIPIMLHSCLCVLNNQPQSILHEMGECIYDQGGYFIMDGKEKVIVAQERIVTNRIFINKSKDPKFSYEGLIRCTSEENPLFPKTIVFHVFADSISMPEEHEDDDDDTSAADEDNPSENKFPRAIIVSSPNISVKIPLFVLFRALGVESDKHILQCIVGDIKDPTNKQMLEFLRTSVLHGAHITNQEQAIEYLSNFVEYKHIDKVKHVLIHDLFPNVGNSFNNKAMFLGHIVNKLVKVSMKITKESDRDSYLYKRVDISGFLIANLFRDYYNQFRQTVRNNVDRQYLFGPWRNLKDISSLINKTNLSFVFQSQIIDDGMRKSLKGSWGVNMVEEQQDADDIKQGLVQDLSRISYLGFISHLRRVNTPIDPTSKIVAPHRLHPSQWGIMCPCESPDGASIGLLKNFAIMCKVTFDGNTTPIMECLKDQGMISLSDVDITASHVNSTKVLVNSNWVGFHNDPVHLCRLLKLLKRNACINIFTSISWDVFNNEIHILTEAGRCCRPVYVVNEKSLVIGKYVDQLKDKKIGWNDLIKNASFDGYTKKMSLEELEANQAPIEYVDVEETNHSLIAMDNTYLSNKLQKYDYCEIHPSTIFSVVTHNIPLANHNQAPRNIFSGAQGKQAIGCYATNFNNRIDTMAYVLHYPQKCLVNTRYCDYLNLNRVPNGENLVVAIATYTGYNMEDSLIMNKTSVERGMFNVTYYKNHIEREEENRNENELITFHNPYRLLEAGKNLTELKWASYKHLDENGFPQLNSYIDEGAAMVGKVKVRTELVEDNTIPNNIFNNKVKQEIYYDRSVIADKTMAGKVDKVFIYVDEQNKKTCKIRFRKVRLPELGDKCCSREAQKGVIGMLVPQEDMPFSHNGIVPDIIINPHAIPSRMTVGHLLEMVLGKAGACAGTTIDGTPFNNNLYDDLYTTLEKTYGFERHGNEILYNGHTGEQMHTDIFMGPIFYERLKHMVADKINYRQVNFRNMTGSSDKREVVLKEAPVSVMTRQPTKGRGNNGGLRIGEMEKDTILSHGMVGFLKESLMERSDMFDYKIDTRTHTIATDPRSIETMSISTPYAFKQLVHELTALGIKPELLRTVDMEEEENMSSNTNNVDRH